MKEFYYEYSQKKSSIEIKHYIYRIGTYHYNWHRDLELLTVLSGRVEVCSGGVSRMLKEDDLILINSNEGHTTLAKDRESIAMVLHLDPMFLKDYYPNVEYLSFHICSENHPEKEKAFEKIRRSLALMMLNASEKEPESRLLFQKSFYDLIYTMISEMPPEIMPSAAFQLNQKKQDAIIKMIRYIHKNYSKKISLDSLARESGYNPSYVSQLFKSYVGINFYDYLTRIRLREATRDLSQSDKKILDIALDHGFSDLKAFNSNFKENFQKSPTEYRKMLNQENKGNDLDFKKKFLESSHPFIRQKLQEYVGQGPENNEAIQKIRRELLDAQKKMEDQSQALDQISQEIKEISKTLKKPI